MTPGARAAVHRYAPAITGIAGIVASVVAADIYGPRTGRPTISATGDEALDHPVAGPVYVGVLAALGWHLLADPIIRKLRRR